MPKDTKGHKAQARDDDADLAGEDITDESRAYLQNVFAVEDEDDTV